LFRLGDEFKPEGLIYVTLTVYLFITRSTCKAYIQRNGTRSLYSYRFSDR